MELFTILIALSLGYLLALTISSAILTDGRGILEKLVDITNFGVIFSIIFSVMLIDGVSGSDCIIFATTIFGMAFLAICGDLYNLLRISPPPNSLRNVNMAQSALTDLITAAAQSLVSLKLCLFTF